jgi:transcriptional regulator with XRE-family HTH domain
LNSQILGQKIKNFRKRAGVSQMELEIECAFAPGTISRIECSKVNPTKETLSTIANTLMMTPSEIASLLNLNICTPEELISAINLISSSLDLKTTLQTAVDIMFDLYPNYNGGVVFLMKDDKVFSKTVSNMPKMNFVFKKILTKKFSQYSVSLTRNKNNFIVKTIKNKKVYLSHSLVDFVAGAEDEIKIKLIEKVLGFRSGISLPMTYQGKIIGATLFTKREKDDFKQEKNVLRLLTDQIAIAIHNSLEYEKLKREIEILQKKLN